MRRWLPAIPLLLPLAARAHGLEAAGFLAGVAHPVGGADHLLAMVAVGIVSTRAGRGLLWALPATFLAGMALGFACGLGGIQFAGAERGVVLSVIVLGLIVALPGRWLPYAAALVVLAFGWCHGYAHGQEWPSHTSPWSFALGFLGTTAGLHAIGAITGLLYLEQPRPAPFFAATGLLVCAVGAAMALISGAPGVSPRSCANGAWLPASVQDPRFDKLPWALQPPRVQAKLTGRADTAQVSTH
jgi:urease accessory protein